MADEAIRATTTGADPDEPAGAAAPDLHHLRHAIERDMRGPDSYLPILLLALGVMVSFPLGAWSPLLFGFVTLPMTLAIVFLSFWRSNASRRTRRIVFTLSVIGTVAAIVASIVHHGDYDDRSALVVVSSLSFALLLILTLPAILARALQHRTVSLNTLAAALSAYLIIGLFFSAFYRSLDAIEAGAFFAQIRDPNLGDFQYFSFVTLTTTGFGDLTAATALGRAAVIFEAVTGQVFLVTMVARVVSNLGQERRPLPED